MGAQHTPGPWSVHCNDVHPTEGDDGKRFWDVCAGNIHKSPCSNYISGYIACPDITIAQVQFGPAEANARLIAAAPDLLAAAIDAETEIRELRTWIDSHVPAESIDPSAWTTLHKPMVTSGVCRNLRAAIAKARGEE